MKMLWSKGGDVKKVKMLLMRHIGGHRAWQHPQLGVREVVEEQNEGVMVQRWRPKEGKNAAHEAHWRIWCMAKSSIGKQCTCLPLGKIKDVSQLGRHSTCFPIGKHV